MNYDYHAILSDKAPSDPEKNALWRAQILDYCSRDHPDAAKFCGMVLERCRKDFWFWVMSFAYVHEPRILDDDAEEFDTQVPFLPWPHQIPVMERILEVLGKRDLRVVKSRAQGASWILVLIFLWCWLFKRGFKGNLVSKDEDTVDTRDDMNALMPKMDWLIERLPVWMTGTRGKDWRRNYGKHTLIRTDGETGVTGYSCTGDVGSGGRAMVFALDEHGKHPRGPDREAMAATQPITRCRLFISTPKGKSGAYHEIVHDETIEEPVLYLSWRDNPTQNRGLYYIVKGQPVAVDEQEYGPLPYGYEEWAQVKGRLLERGYDLTDHATRSQWYDQECLRPGANPVLIAQEYDMKFGAEGAQYFAQPLINRLKTTVRRPLRGELRVDPETITGTWTENPDGRFKLWCELDISNRPPMGDYVVAGDVCAGIGGSMTSNSALTVFNRRTGAKVASFASPSVLPYTLAEVAIALCRWFINYSGAPAFLIWEANGYGQEFKLRVEQTTFNHYYRRKTKDAPLNSRHTDKPGYWTYKRSVILGPYREALLEGYFDNPEYEAIEELSQYQMGADGEPYHVGETDKQDPAGAKAAHGDRCFVGGTAILTDRGEVPIEELAPGDLVWTRNGLRPVRACGKTGEERVFEAELSNGRFLVGTGNHPIWTENRGFIALSSLMLCDTLLGWQHQHPESEVRFCRAVKPIAGRRDVYNLSVLDTPEYFAQGILVHNCIADALAWEACVTFGDQLKTSGYQRKPNVMNATEGNVPRHSFAYRRAQYLKMMGKKKLKTTW